MANKDEMAEIVGRRQWFNVPVPDIIGRIKGDINLRQRPQGDPPRSAMKFWGEKGETSYPWKSARHLVHHRKHPLGHFGPIWTYQGAGRQDQPLGPVAEAAKGLGLDHADRRQPRRRDLL
jgi:nitrate/nitrite transport system substrate-binding protein